MSFEDFPIRVGNIVVPCDFVVLDMAEDPYTPLILSRDALKTLGELNDYVNETITLRVAHEKSVFAFSMSSKKPMVEQLYSLTVVGIADKKKGEEVATSVDVVSNDVGYSNDNVKKKRKKKKKNPRKKIGKKKKMAPAWLGGVPHIVHPPGDPGLTLLSSTNFAEWSVLSHHAGGDGDARSESTPISGMFSCIDVV